MSDDYSAFAKPVDDYASFAKPVEDYSSFAKPVEEESGLGTQIKEIFTQFPAGIERAGTAAGEGLSNIIGSGIQALGGMGVADANRARAAKIAEESNKRTDATYGKPTTTAGEISAGVGGGVANLAALAANPVVGFSALAGGGAKAAQNVQEEVSAMGGGDTLSKNAARLEAVSNLALGLVPGAGAIKGALINWGTGVVTDDALYAYLASEGRPDIAKKVRDFRGLGLDKQGIIDLIVGGTGGKVFGPNAPQAKGDPKAIKGNLDMQDRKNLDQVEAQQTTSQQTLYVGKQGDVTDTLPTRIEETPEALDLARTQQQNQLEASPWEPAQRDMFPIQTDATQGLMDLRTEPDRSGLARQEDLTQTRERQDSTYEITPEDPAVRARKEAEEGVSNAPAFIAKPEEIKPWIQRVIEIEEQGNKLTHLEPKQREEWKATQRLAERQNRYEWFKDYADTVTLDRSLIKDGKADVGEVLRSVLNDSEAAAVRPDLVALVKDLAPYIRDLDLQVRPEAEVVSGKNRTGEDKMVPGFYNRLSHQMVLGQNGWTLRIFMHELVHAATARALDAFARADGKFTSKAPEAVKNLQKILDHVRSLATSMGEKGWYLDGAAIYGLTDLHEFAAEIKTNRYLQKTLREMSPIKGLGTGNVLKQWWSQVAKMLGISKSPANTLFEQAAGYTSEVVKFQAESPAIINSALKQKWSSFKNFRELTNSPAPEALKGLDNLGKVDAEDAKAATLAKTTGIEYVAKDPVVDEALIAKIAKEEDGSSLWAFTPGALARAIGAKSTLVMTGYRLMDNAAKRIAFKTKEIIAPVEKAFASLLRSDANSEILHDLFMRELKNKRDYTPDELREAGVSDDLIMAHLEFRNMMEQLREQQNIALADKGLPPVDRLQSFITSRWSGPWRANLRDAEGNIVWQVAEHSRGKAKAALEYIMERQPNLKADDLTYRQGRERSDSVEAGYQDMLKLLDPEDERVKTLQSIYEDYILGKTENVAQQEKHFLTKTGVRGFAGDRPWSKTDARDMFVQQFEYAKNALKWAEYQKAVDKVKPLLQDPSIQESQKNNIAYLKEYSKNHLGFGTAELFSRIDNAAAKFLGVSPQTLQTGMGAAKTYFYLSRLGLSIPFTITQFIQPAVTNPAWHSQLSAEGYWHNPVKTAVLGTLVGVEAATWHYMKLLGGDPKMVESLMDSVDKDAARWMEANGIVEINQLADIKKDMRPTAVKTVAAPFEFTIQHSEIIARSIAFMSYVQHLKQSNAFDLDTAKGRAELFQKAEDMTKISMTDYRSTERALVFERGGLMGDAAATLHSYQFNNLFQLWNFSKEFKNGNTTPLMNFMFMQFLAAGLTGLWFVDDLDDMLDNLKKMLPHDDYMKWKDKSIKGFILNNANDAMAYGLVSKVTGTNIHTRMNAADQLPIYPFEPMDMTSVQGLGKSLGNIAGNAVPFAGVAGNLGAAAIQLPRNSVPDRRKWEAGYAAAPAVAQGPMERLPAFNDGKMSKNPNRIEEGFRARTEKEKNLRDLGFRSTAEQRQKDKMFANSKIEKELEIRLKRASTNSTDHFLDGNTKKGVTELVKYVDLGGDPATVLNGLPKAKLKGMTTELQRRAMDAGSGSRAAILKLQRYIQNVGIE